MAYNDPQLLHYDSILSGISVGYQNDDFVGEALFPTVGVDKQSDKYYVHSLQGVTPMDDFRSPRSQANELPPMTLTKDQYFATEHALVDIVPREEVQNADPALDPMVDATERVSDTILLNREFAMMQMVTTPSNYATGHTVTLSGGAQWDTYATSDPIGDLKTAREAVRQGIFRAPNTVLWGWQAWLPIEDHPAFLDRIRYSERAVNTVDIVQQMVGIPGRWIMGTAQYNTAAVGLPASMSYLWGKDVVLAYVPAGPGRKQAAFGYEFNWRYPTGETMPTERWFDTDIDSTKVRTRRRYDLKFASVDDPDSVTPKATGGYLIKSAVS